MVASPDDQTVTVVLVAHGSRASSANQAHLDLAAALDARIEPTVLGAFMELAEPSIGDAIGRAVDAGATVVAVLPYFLHPGRHQQVDIPSWCRGGGEPSVVVARPLRGRPGGT
jgi:sirohydrochlorin ferrochelatase